MIALMAVASPVSAMSGGETDQFYFSECDMLTVNITPYAGEFVMDMCTNDFNGSFTCACSDDYTFNLTSRPNAVGEFDVTLTNYYEPPEPAVVTDYTHMVGIGPVQKETVIVDRPYVPKEINETIRELEDIVAEQEDYIDELIDASSQDAAVVEGCDNRDLVMTGLASACAVGAVAVFVIYIKK